MGWTVKLRLEDGSLHSLGEGALLGRARAAHLRVDDPGVSEAHAFLTARGGQLRIQALRGGVRVNGVPVRECALHRGQRVELGPSFAFTVESVEGPEDPDLAQDSTQGDPDRPLRLHLSAEGVRIDEGGPPLQLSGNTADLVRLLVDAAEPVHWSEVARWFWPERDRHQWRARFDATVKELRAKLRERHIRVDLLASSEGLYRLNLGPKDTVTRAAAEDAPR